MKVALQTGARFIPSAGLIAAGTGSVDFAQSRKIADQGLLTSLLSTVQNLLGLSSGASFVDRGTLIDRVYDRTGIRLLGLLDLGALLGGADGAESGVLSLLGQSNPIGSDAGQLRGLGHRRRLDVQLLRGVGHVDAGSVGPVRRLGHGGRRRLRGLGHEHRSEPRQVVMSQPAAAPARPAALRALHRSGVCRRPVPLRAIASRASPVTGCPSSGGCSPR